MVDGKTFASIDMIHHNGTNSTEILAESLCYCTENAVYLWWTEPWIMQLVLYTCTQKRHVRRREASTEWM